MRQVLRRHGRSHRPGGSDPIPGLEGLRYDTDNEGDWFFAAANDASTSPGVGYTDQAGNTYAQGFSWQFDTGTSDAPFAITNDGDFLVDTSGVTRLFGGSGVDIKSFGSGITIDSAAGGIDILSGGGGLTINSDGGGLDVLSGGGGLLLNTTGGAGGTMELRAWDGSNNGAKMLLNPGTASVVQLLIDGDLEIQIAPGTKFTLLDHSGNPKVQWTEGAADLHIPTGGTVVADL